MPGRGTSGGGGMGGRPGGGGIGGGRPGMGGRPPFPVRPGGGGGISLTPAYNYSWYPSSNFWLYPYGSSYGYQTTFPFPANTQWNVGMRVVDSNNNVWTLTAINGSTLTWVLTQAAANSTTPVGATLNLVNTAPMRKGRKSKK